MRTALFNRGLELQLHLREALDGSHSGRCDDDIAAIRTLPYVARQLDAMDAAELRAELREYGAWDDDQLSDHDANLSRVLWLACGNVSDEAFERHPDLMTGLRS